MNLPNKLSIFRVLLVPVIAFVYLFPFVDYGISLFTLTIHEVTLPATQVITLIIFAVASFSDFLDGYIARKYQMITSFGKFIDPIADKLLVNSVLILLAVSGMISIIPVLFMVWRDIIVDAMRMMAAQKGVVVAAGIWGKLKTVVQMIGIIVVLLNDIPFTFIGLEIGSWLIWIAAIVSGYSGIVYFKQCKQYVMESK